MSVSSALFVSSTLLLMLAASIEARPYEILDPNSGRPIVNTENEEQLTPNVLPLATERLVAVTGENKVNEVDKGAEEYYTPEGSPVYKIVKKYPYGHIG